MAARKKTAKRAPTISTMPAMVAQQNLQPRRYSTLRADLQRALALYSQMRAQGLRLDSRGLLAATRLCDAHGRPDLSARLRQERSMDLPFGGAGKQRRSGGNS